MKKIFICALILGGCTKIDTNKNPGNPPPAITDYQWVMMPSQGAPSARKEHSAIWTGSEWILWGGIVIPSPESLKTNEILLPNSKIHRELFASGASFNPENSTWKQLTIEGVPDKRFGHTAVWTGSEMLVWGGAQATTIKTGGRYRPRTNTWTPMSTPDALTDRYYHRAVWTGKEMFVWGGYHLDQQGLNSGALYYPASDSWELLPTEGAPGGRHHFSMTLVGRKVFIWGGIRTNEAGTAYSDGAVYDLRKKTWSMLPSTGAPTARGFHSAVYGRKKIIVWGGQGRNENGDLSSLQDGAFLNIRTGEWKKMNTAGAPSARFGHTAVWTGKKMLVWGGLSGGIVEDNGALYDPEKDTWEPLPQKPSELSERYGATGTWTGDSFLVWGGSKAVRGDPNELGDGAILKFPSKDLEN